ncbi:NAD-dependent epimerase/dehydratase family protein [Candidatus Parcubacteria bacterium]|nr:MAG: NAD-dependent epimerase/dehydratase family protein [Candidatus Parcubacteria bacterium]
MKKVLITGGAGFIGYFLTQRLLGMDAELRVVLVDNFKRGRKDGDLQNLLADSRVELMNLDLTDPASYRKIGAGYAHVYHLAAMNGTKLFYDMPHEVLRTNTLSLIYMLEWFREKNPEGKFCFTSSNEAYAGGLNAFGALPIPTPEKVPLVIEDPYNARWSYASTKLVGELFVIHYAKAYNFRALILRPHNFYGPRAGYGGHVIPEFCERISAHTDPFPVYGAEYTRTFCYITDAVRAMQLLMDSPKTDHQPIETVHIGDFNEITILELAEKLFEVAGWHPKALDIKNPPAGSVKRRLADVSKLQKLTGWQPEVSLEKGLQETFRWYATHPSA